MFYTCVFSPDVRQYVVENVESMNPFQEILFYKLCIHEAFPQNVFERVVSIEYLLQEFYIFLN